MKQWRLSCSVEVPFLCSDAVYKRNYNVHRFQILAETGRLQIHLEDSNQKIPFELMLLSLFRHRDACVCHHFQNLICSSEAPIIICTTCTMHNMDSIASTCINLHQPASSPSTCSSLPLGCRNLLSDMLPVHVASSSAGKRIPRNSKICDATSIFLVLLVLVLQKNRRIQLVCCHNMHFLVWMQPVRMMSAYLDLVAPILFQRTS
jgi:hypothetical protein